MRVWLISIAVCLGLTGCAGYKPRKEDVQPEVSNLWQDAASAIGQQAMVVTPHPMATDIAYKILQEGGTAVDAAIAAQAMLTLVEPFASGVGGGGYMLVYDARTGKVKAYDGREMAPASARPEMFLQADGSPRAFDEALLGGQSVGVPGLVKMLDVAHQRHGKTPWRQLWLPTARQAEQGFIVSERLHTLIASDPTLAENDTTRRYFFTTDGAPLPIGIVRRNQALAETMRLIADYRAKGFYESDVMQELLDAVQNSSRNPARITAEDVAGYQVKEYDAICSDYRGYTVCGMPPSSSGGIVTLQVLEILESFDMASLGEYTPESVHVFAEASRLAYADRDAYIADPAFLPYDQRLLLNATYIRERAALIKPNRAAWSVKPGRLPKRLSDYAAVAQPEPESTSHISVVDKFGNAVSLTASIEHTFGSQLMVAGFLLNNQLTDFTFTPTQGGKPVANRPEAGKRPRSSMSPTIVLNKQQRVHLVTGSPGGARIPLYVLKSLITTLDWNYSAEQAVNAPNIANRYGQMELEDRPGMYELGEQLHKKRHDVVLTNLTSGVNLIKRSDNGGWEGASDPRREGTAKGM